jgi:hypothetical protein
MNMFGVPKYTFNNFQIWTFSSPNLKCQPEDEMCPSQLYPTSILAEFWVFRQKLENMAKVLE